MSNYIIHSAKGTTWSKKNAKYISKKKVNGKWVYYYSDPVDRTYQQLELVNASTREKNIMSSSPNNPIGASKMGPYSSLDDVIDSLNRRKQQNIKSQSYDKVRSQRTISDANKKYDEAIAEANKMKDRKNNSIPTVIKKRLIKHGDYMDGYGYLIHSFKGTTWEKDNHKYTSRKKLNGKWQYTYTNGDSKIKIESDFDANDTAKKFTDALTGTADMIDTEVNRYKNKKNKEKVKITTKTYDRTPTVSNKKVIEEKPKKKQGVPKNTSSKYEEQKKNKEHLDRLAKQQRQEAYEQEAAKQKAAYEERQKINKKLKSPTYRLKNAAKPKVASAYNKLYNRAKKQDEFVRNIKTAASEKRRKRKLQAYSKKQIR